MRAALRGHRGSAEHLPPEWLDYELAREFGWRPSETDGESFVVLQKILDLSRLDRTVTAEQQAAAANQKGH